MGLSPKKEGRERRGKGRRGGGEVGEDGGKLWEFCGVRGIVICLLLLLLLFFSFSFFVFVFNSFAQFYPRFLGHPASKKRGFPFFPTFLLALHYLFNNQQQLLQEGDEVHLRMFGLEKDLFFSHPFSPPSSFFSPPPCSPSPSPSPLAPQQQCQPLPSLGVFSSPFSCSFLPEWGGLLDCLATQTDNKSIKTEMKKYFSSSRFSLSAGGEEEGSWARGELLGYVGAENGNGLTVCVYL